MIGLDTNVLVRYLVEDAVSQSRRATTLIEEAIARNDQLFISDIVMCEMVWVLSSAYRFSRTEIVDALAGLLRAKSVVFNSTDRLARSRHIPPPKVGACSVSRSKRLFRGRLKAASF